MGLIGHFLPAVAICLQKARLPSDTANYHGIYHSTEVWNGEMGLCSPIFTHPPALARTRISRALLRVEDVVVHTITLQLRTLQVTQVTPVARHQAAK